MTNEHLYKNMLDAVQPLFSETERMVSALSETGTSDEVFCARLSQLAETGTTLRREATNFLTSDAVSAFDEALVYDAKRHVHTDIGRVLMQTRVYPDTDGLPDACRAGQDAGEKPEQNVTAKITREELCSAWQEILVSLKTGIWRKETVDIKKQITDAAVAAGVSVVFEQEPPREEADLRAYVKDATSKILAAVRAGETAVIL